MQLIIPNKRERREEQHSNDAEVGAGVGTGVGTADGDAVGATEGAEVDAGAEHVDPYPEEGFHPPACTVPSQMWTRDASFV